ncbi:MAG TPA: 3-isopropylmalate dehydrogenase [Candidatus Elarobacter sp.]
MTHRVAVLGGDGIGPEVTAAAVRVLRAALPGCCFDEAPVGGAAISACGVPLPDETLAIASASDAILFGAVGGPGFDDLPPERRPEAALLALRKAFGLYANVRPARAFPGLEDRSPLRAELVRGMDCVIVRELTGGLYFGPKRIERDAHGTLTATDTLIYTEPEIERIARFAFELAGTRRGRVTSVDKANVMMSSQLWRRVVNDVARAYPGVALEHVLVDNAAMQLVRDPRAVDVILTENMFGDILSDEAAMITGTIGTAPSASLGAGPHDRGFGLYEPISGTAPDIAGRGIANPTGAILSAALLARFSLGEDDVAWRIEHAVAETLALGPRTADLDAVAAVSTSAFTDAVIGRLAEPALSDAALRMGV